MNSANTSVEQYLRSIQSQDQASAEGKKKPTSPFSEGADQLQTLISGERKKGEIDVSFDRLQGVLKEMKENADAKQNLTAAFSVDIAEMLLSLSRVPTSEADDVKADFPKLIAEFFPIPPFTKNPLGDPVSFQNSKELANLIFGAISSLVNNETPPAATPAATPDTPIGKIWKEFFNLQSSGKNAEINIQKKTQDFLENANSTFGDHIITARTAEGVFKGGILTKGGDLLHNFFRAFDFDDIAEEGSMIAIFFASALATVRGMVGFIPGISNIIDKNLAKFYAKDVSDFVNTNGKNMDKNPGPPSDLQPLITQYFKQYESTAERPTFAEWFKSTPQAKAITAGDAATLYTYKAIASLAPPTPEEAAKSSLDTVLTDTNIVLAHSTISGQRCILLTNGVLLMAYSENGNVVLTPWGRENPTADIVIQDTDARTV